MSPRVLVLGAGVAVLLAATPAEAGKLPLTREQLEKESKLIVAGQVLSHREEDQPGSGGGVTRYVFLTVKVDTVVKGDAKPGDEIVVRCWVVVKEPGEGVLWDDGHSTIPGDGGKAKFFLTGPREGAWRVIVPNGVELLDGTPPRRYERERAPFRPPPLGEQRPIYGRPLFVWPFIAVVLAAIVLRAHRRRHRPPPLT
jgi:hypothetical protein